MENKHIMSVDDSSSVRHIVKSYLEPEGYDVAEATDGLEALDKIKTGHFDLLIVDVNMPRMNGIEFVKEARKLDGYSNVPIIILTTENQEDMKLQGMKAGANGWIVKPFQPQQFIKVINKLVN